MEIRIRICSQCKAPKELNEINFYRNKRHKGGFLAACKVCVASKSAQYRKDHPEVLKARDAKRKADPVAYAKKLEMTRAWRDRMTAEGKMVGIKQKQHLGYLYQMTPEQYDATLAEQGGACAVCKQPAGAKRLCVDHDHGCCPVDSPVAIAHAA